MKPYTGRLSIEYSTVHLHLPYRERSDESLLTASRLAITAEWTDSADNELARSGMHQLVASIQSTASARGCLIDYEFMNDGSYVQSPLKTLQEETLEFLKKTSRKYDREQFFQKLQNGGFLLSKA